VNADCGAPLANCHSPLSWAGLYRRDYDLATPASTAHPAKASWDLAFKILEHLGELGLADPKSDTILDYMCGTGRFNLAACAQGFKAVGIELEPRFIEFCRQNKTYAEKRLGRELDWQIIQGDARHLSQLLQERGLVALTSPPYSDSKNNSKHGIRGELSPDLRGRKVWEEKFDGNPDNPDNIANLPDRPLRAIVSPPYEDSDTRDDYQKRKGYFDRAGGLGHEKAIYPNAEGQIGQERGETYQSAMLKCYQEAIKVASVLVVVVKNPTRKGKLYPLDQITCRLMEAAGWKVLCRHRALLFEEQEQGVLIAEAETMEADWPNAVEFTETNWPGLGWRYVRTPTEQAFEVLFGKWDWASGIKPDTGYWVRMVPAGTLKLEGKRVKGRLSFFKRLQWQKGKSEIAQFEDIIFATREGEGMKAVVSPPYEESRTVGGDVARNLWGEQAKSGYKDLAGYGSSPGQIGNLRDKGG
jgi:hypothetical protein